MRRFLLIATAIVSALLGAVVAWLVLTVPNDLQAGALLRTARTDVEAGRNDRARQEYSRVIQQYPRTDAAAAATVALASIADNERHILSAALDQQRRTLAAQQKQIADLAAQINAIRNTPPPAPVVIQAPPPPAKKTPPQHSRRKRHP
ncbi:MAG TPA: tetratricopeptide repeat protein [Thermoanaerobaculia bacterium]|nr:tetratricopeptide repeat protein [Thermoanaerobaculia bacterium]